MRPHLEGTRRPGRLSVTEPLQTVGIRRWRLTSALAVCGSALGAAAVIITFIARTPFPKDPERMELAPTLIVASAAAVAGLVAGAILIRLVTSEFVDPVLVRPRNPLVW